MIMRISADYRNNGTERSVIGFDYSAGKWCVETGTCTEPFACETFTADTVHHFDDDTEALRWTRANGYR